MWPKCEFQKQVWNVLHAVRCKYRMQKIIKNLPPGHHRTTLSGYIFATKAWIDNRKKNCQAAIFPPHAPQYGELRPTSGWDRSGSLGHPSKFQRVSHLGSVTAATSLKGSQQNFARCLAISWAGTLHIYFGGALAPLWNFARCNINFASSKSCALVFWQRYCTALEQWARAKLCGVEHRAPSVFGRATIMLGIGPHSSIFLLDLQ